MKYLLNIKLIREKNKNIKKMKAHQKEETQEESKLKKKIKKRKKGKWK